LQRNGSSPDPESPDRAGLNPAGSVAETIRRGEELYRVLAAQLPNVALVVFDRELRVLVAQGEALMSYGVHERDAEGQPLRDALAPETYDGLHALCQATLEGERRELEQHSPDGERCFRVFGKPMLDANHRVWAGMILAQDITHLRASEHLLRARANRLEDLAHHDDLTGLPNRTLLRDRLEHALARAVREGLSVAFLYLDLDRFKNVNDTLGHEAGDELLQCVARRLGEAVRAADTVGRLGGDEFVVIAEGVREDTDVLTAVERVFAAFGAPMTIAGSELWISASVGVAVGPRDGATSDALMAAADKAMYGAKEAGSNCHRFFDRSMDDRARERLTLEAEMRHAVRRDEFVLHYQPAVALQTGHVVSVEALVRWNHPRRGFLGPGEFIPIAEQTGFAAEITEWVLQRACRDAQELQRDGAAPVRVAVNCCSRELAGGLLELAGDALRANDLDAECLELEVTERFLGHDDAVRDEMLAQLKELGVSIALDDFGTGYSSLLRLQTFPVDVIKIDRRFIAELPEQDAIARSIIGLAANLDLRVIAEGIEHEAQRTWLKATGCDAASGFWICRPMPIEQLATWLRSQMEI
jgi:diguanylate cyclase (GGDEF)-like protein/PAS domain S-box-containing protein